MTARIFAIGSINIDQDCLVGEKGAIGESKPIIKYNRLVGGKGANQAQAARRAGANVLFMGKVGCDGEWILGELRKAGFDTSSIIVDDTICTGHVIINRFEDATPSVMLYYAGANCKITLDEMKSFIRDAQTGDILLIQNEIAGMREMLGMVGERGMRVCFNPSPAIHDDWQCHEYGCEWLILNESEFLHIVKLYDITSEGTSEEKMALLKSKLQCRHLICSFGANGVVGIDSDGKVYKVAAPKVTVVDTVGAGDCLAGFFAASISQDRPFPEALKLATTAASIKVCRYGAFDGIPSLEDVLKYLY
jgi:ribokinase